MKTFEQQRRVIQRQVNEYFKTKIEIAPRAMAALQGTGAVNWDEFGYVVDVEAVFQALLASSPACLMVLHNAGVDTTKLSEQFARRQERLAPLAGNTLDLVFHGYEEAEGFLIGEDWTERDTTIEHEVIRTRKLTEIDMFRAMLDTAYLGPARLREYASPSHLETPLSDVGSLLVASGFADPLALDEKIDRHGRYCAAPLAAAKFRVLAGEAKKLDIYDPSHDLVQFALYYDSVGRIRVRPFGLTAVGLSQPDFLSDGLTYKYRNNVLQPFHTLHSGISDATIGELEDMMNSRSCSEAEFQRFFEHHPDFLLGFSYRRAHPQLILSSDENPDRVPDFFLEPLESAFCDVLELKLPYAGLVRRLRNGARVRFGAFINEAIAQLIEYQRYFDEAANRRSFHQKYGLEAYKPRLILVIGRTHHFQSDAERRELSQLLPKDLEMWTYDDLLARARQFTKFANDALPTDGQLTNRSRRRRKERCA